jgi:anion-transporting  ArsA/GET3 family ATPase
MGLLDLLERRLLIVTGKGGVGKTTLTAALAHAFASDQQRVLCAEIAMDEESPSALGSTLGAWVSGDEPVPVTPMLHAVRLTPSTGHRRFLQDTLPLKVLADAAMRSQGLRRFLSAAPGFQDMGIMYRMLDLMRRERSPGVPEYEICIIDAPATGHALALAQIPEFLSRVIPRGPIGRVAREGVAVLTDPKQTGCVIVTLPETLPVSEAIELSHGLTKHKLQIAAIVMNRVPLNPFSLEERAAVSKLLSGPTPILGSREMHRIDRAHSAAKQLEQQATVQTMQIAEVAEPTTAKLIAAIANRLKNDELMPRVA